VTALPEGTLELIISALEEDLGAIGDITTDAVIAPDARSAGVIVARRSGCVAGIGVAAACFRVLDADLEVIERARDGDIVAPGAVLIEVSGRTRSILSAERVALNFLGRLSGIATATWAYVDAVAGTGAGISDTRKTTPGLRRLEKLAVAAGGGRNHRFGLYDAVLIKDNHTTAAGSVVAAVSAARGAVGEEVVVEVEVDTLDQLADVLTTDADAVLLDNMTPDQLRTAVSLVAGRITTEASGGVTLDTVREIAESGVDVISVGWLTHSAPALDVALDLRSSPNPQFENV
jgi:nicotinate-nucleotide pyrophosphorylase (carboxylating)